MLNLSTVSTLLSLDQIPFWLKVSVTLFVCVVVPVYCVQYGPGNFLWFSDLALLLAVPALWFESALLASMMALSVGVLELAWIADFLVRLVTGTSIFGLSAYMFDSKILLSIRALSLFHVVLPVLLIWIVFRLGYDTRALIAQTLAAWIVLLLSYQLTKQTDNVNWVYGFGNKPQRRMPPLLHLAMMMVLFPLVIYLPTHLVMNALFG